MEYIETRSRDSIRIEHAKVKIAGGKKVLFCSKAEEQG